jgi:uncharacterized protein (TIGR00369 family)
MTPADDAIAKNFGLMSPHMRRIGFQVLSVREGVCVGKLTFKAELVGDLSTGVLHGGVVTTLLDTTGGAAVLSALGAPIPLATLDLRIDYLRPSLPGRDLYARVECYKKTRNIAFARGIAYDGEESDAVAAMAATYMLRTQASRLPGGH